MNDEMLKCNCGKPAKYTLYFQGTNVPRGYSCNKYDTCPTYETLRAERNKLLILKNNYELTLQKIVRVNAMDYEYKTWAKQCLENNNG